VGTVLSGPGALSPVGTDVDYHVENRVATITLAAPERLNAMRPSMAQAVMAAFDAADVDDDVRAIVVTGAGRAFCAGADLSDGVDVFAEDPSLAQVPPDIAGQVALKIFDCRKLVVGAINGPAVGFGATLTLPMDLRIGSETARFSFPFASRGISPDGCSSWFLPRLVGLPTALDWMISGRMVDSTQALQCGLLQGRTTADELLSGAQSLARTMVEASAPVSVALCRRLLWDMQGASHPMTAHLAESRALFERGTSADAREGVSAFLEKRMAAFPDRLSGRSRPTYDLPAAAGRESL
jgi:enoyl-CoA hydratase/carnithine racemase